MNHAWECPGREISKADRLAAVETMTFAEATACGTACALPRDEALAFAERAERAVEKINDLHDDPHGTSTQIARTRQELGMCLKLAEVHATLAIAEELAELRRLAVSGAVTL